MHNMKNKLNRIAMAALFLSLAVSCQKMKRPALGDYPPDTNPVGGPLKFYAAYDGTSNDPLRNAVDSIRANFASSNPLTSIDGVTGKGIQGADQSAIKYASPNDFAGSTSFTVCMWIKNDVPGGGNPQFLFSLPDKDYWAKSAMFALVDHTGAGSTVDSAVLKFYINDNGGDHWFELTGANRMYRILDNQWHHLAFAYDETTSDLAIYRDGEVYKTLNWSGHGPFTIDGGKVFGFVVGGMNKHVGLEGPTDGWIQSWQGGMDQFRLYNKALTTTEVQALYNSRL